MQRADIYVPEHVRHGVAHFVQVHRQLFEFELACLEFALVEHVVKYRRQVFGAGDAAAAP
jgi:hypothetical protein